MIPEIWSTTDRIFYHFGPFYPTHPPPTPIPLKNLRHSHFTQVYHKWQSYMVPEINWNRQTLLVILVNFLLFYPPSPEDIITLHKCTKTHDHRLYCPWEMMCDKCSCCFSFWTIFCPFTPLPPPRHNKPKYKNFKKTMKKTSGDIIILHKCTTNHDHMCYTGPEIWHVAHVIVIFHFGLFLPFYPSNNHKKSKFQKTKGKTACSYIIILHMSTLNYD